MKNFKPKRTLSIVGLLFNITMALLIGLIASATIGVPALAVAGPILLVGTVPQFIWPNLMANNMPKGAYVAITVTIWLSQLEELLFPDNSFADRAVDDTPFVSSGGNTVVIPQSGAAPNVEVNRSNLPAAISQRTDTTNDYPLEFLTSDPTLITDIEQLEVSYPKLQSILMPHAQAIETKAAATLAVNWTPDGADNQVRTTGASRPAGSPGATGSRKALTRADFVDGLTLLRRMDVPINGICALVPASMLGDLFKIDDFVHVDKIGGDALRSGIIGRILGVDLYIRSTGVVFTNASPPVKKAYNAATTTADNEAIIMWHPNFVRKAKGQLKVYEKIDDPAYYGSLFSASLYYGGKYGRSDKKGIVAIIEAHA
jgi:hypothetical protein